jgi:ankyrin repeat protein
MKLFSKNKPSKIEIELLESVIRGDINAVEKCLKAGASVNVQDNQLCKLPFYTQATPLMYAADKGNLEMVRLLLKSGADVSLATKSAEEDGGAGSEALHFAVPTKNLALVEELLNAGANPNAVGRYGRTPLVVAIYEQNMDCAKLLLSRGADVKLKTDRKNYLPPISAAADVKNPALIELVLQAGGDANTVDRFGQTPLIVVARAEKLPDETVAACLELLLAAKANPGFTDRSGTDALGWAIQRHNPAAVKVLVKGGANVNRVESGGAMLDLAEKEAKGFADMKANPNLPERHRPLVEEKSRRTSEVVSILKEAGAKRKTEM